LREFKRFCRVFKKIKRSHFACFAHGTVLALVAIRVCTLGYTRTPRSRSWRGAATRCPARPRRKSARSCGGIPPSRCRLRHNLPAERKSGACDKHTPPARRCQYSPRTFLQKFGVAGRYRERDFNVYGRLRCSDRAAPLIGLHWRTWH
jgi:hypothetical protein